MIVFKYKGFASLYFMRNATETRKNTAGPKATTGPKAYIPDTLHDRIERKGAEICLNSRKYVAASIHRRHTYAVRAKVTQHVRTCT